MDEPSFLAWLDAYERAWRAPGTDALAEIFAPDAAYLTSPYAEPIVGLDAIGEMWEAERDGPEEVFTMTREVVALTGDVGVARVLVRYGDPVRQEYLDLWVVTVDSDGRATRFEEWPFWPSQQSTPSRPGPVVVDAAAVDAAPWREVVRSEALSAGVYALASGAADGQRPHAQDEVYVVVSGAAHLEVEGQRHPVSAGTIAYVPARARHRFVDITDDLRTAVVFAPPEAPDN